MKQITFLFLMLLSSPMYAQYSIDATVVDKSGKKIQVGDVILYQKGEVIQYTSINEGKFSFESLLKGTYVLKIMSMGYEGYEKELNLDGKKRFTIVLKESLIALDEVTIKARKKVLENKNGNIVANVEGTMLSKETSTVTLLSKLPNIQISANGEEVSVLGKGTPLIYIGGQRISMEELQSISVEDIKSVEIIQNPSAKYEAEGRSVLLITKRRSKREGTQVSIIERASSKTFFNNSLGTNVTIKKKSLEYRLNANYNQLKVWEKNTAAYEVTDQNIFSDYTVEAITTRPQFVFGAGMYYPLNDTDYISFNTRYRTQKEPFTIDTNTFLSENGVEENINTTSDNVGKRNFSSSNINYFRSFTKKRNLFIGVQYTDYTRDVENNILNTYSSSPTEQVDISQHFNVKSVVVKGDYDVTYQKGTKLELGFNYANNVSNSLLEINTDVSDYKYTERIQGLYAQFSGKNKTLSYAVGLRVEDTKVEGGFRDRNELLIDRENVYLFPRGNVDIELGKETSLNLSFVKSITRPNYATAVATTAFINPALEFQGNINLKPRITSEISSIFQYKNKTVSLRYYRSKDPVNYRFFYDEVRDISVMSPTNFDEEVGWALDFLIPLNYKFWTSTNSLSFNYNTLNDVRAAKNRTTPYVYLYSSHQFKINNVNSFGIDGWFLTNRKDGIFNRREVFTLNATYTTKLFSKLDVTFSVNDIFNTMEFEESYVLQNLSVNNFFFTDVHEFSIALKYVFGIVKDSQYKNRNVDNELNRIK